MRITNVLFRQHIGRMFKKHWQVQGKRVVIDTKADVELNARQIPIFDPKEVLKEHKEKYNFPAVVGWKEKEVVYDETHPNWHEQSCYQMKDSNVLLEGLEQAQVLLKTVKIENPTPSALQPYESEKINDEDVKKVILSCHLFDAEQKKLPIVKDPLRPAWNFPRDYGITTARKTNLLSSNLIRFCETNSTTELNKKRFLLENVSFCTTLEKNDDLIQFQLRGDKLLTSSTMLPKIFNNNSIKNVNLPNIYPIKDTITIPVVNIYKPENLYPVPDSKYAPHTVFVHHDNTEVSNLYETDVTEKQILGRGLIKSFTVAASFARTIYGMEVKNLPDPIIVQCVNTDGRFFHFGIFQLNTLDLNDENDLKNIWSDLPMQYLYESCTYSNGIPKLVGYNPSIMKHLLAFYKSN